ncbi:hypothetical protein J4E91_010417 [Alternaria rosae]|nr:hypothetical protein J4E91_010417 [Alternaria rosae]
MARPGKASVLTTSSLSAERGRRKTHNSASQEEEEDMLDNITLTPLKSQPKQKLKATLSLKTPGEFDHVVLKDEADCNEFLSKTDESEAYLQDMKTLEVHLDASKMVAYTEDRFALALNKLHPRPGDATNPHNLQTIRLVVKGNTLLTLLSKFVDGKLKKLADGKLSDEERNKLPYKINSTEKLLASALLGIRGVKQVSIESKGKGTVEADFVATIKATLVQPPGTAIVEVSDEESEFSKHTLNRLGLIYSQAYSGNALNPYAALIPPGVELVDDSEGSEDDAQAAAVVKLREPVTRRPKEGVPIVVSGPRMRGTMAKQAEEVGENEEEDEDSSLGAQGDGSNSQAEGAA